MCRLAPNIQAQVLTTILTNERLIGFCERVTILVAGGRVTSGQLLNFTGRAHLTSSGHVCAVSGAEWGIHVAQVSDEGGGIPRSGVSRIWTYLYTTANSPLELMDQSGEGEGPAVLAGYGYGLPISRLYARYFGGELQIISMEGYGTDAYLHLNRLGNVQEPLP